MGTILGSVLLPVCAWACGRFFRLRPPLPTLLAAATLPFLFDYTFTIYGGNLFSTLAGEYAFSFSLSLAMLFLGLFACAVREGRYRGWAAVVLAVLRAVAHRPGSVRAGGRRHPDGRSSCCPPAGGLPTRDSCCGATTRRPEPVPRTRILWWAGSTVGIGLLLTGWWLVPFGLEHAYTTSMGYTNVEGWAQYFREADAWALVLAGLGAVTAFLVRSRFGITVTVLGIVSALATALDPQGSLYNVRLLPLWFISVYLMAAWTFGAGCIAVARVVAPGAGPALGGSQARAAVGRGSAALRPGRRAALPRGLGRRGRLRPHAPTSAVAGWGPAAVSGAVSACSR